MTTSLNSKNGLLPSEVKLKERRRVFQGVEYQPLDIPLESLIIGGKLSIYPMISGEDYFKFYVKKDKLVFQASGYIGLIPINDNVVLDIRTRVPVRNLERLLLVADHSPKILKFYSRDYSSSNNSFPSLIEILAEALIEALQPIEKYGFYREYISIEKNTSFPKGKILVGNTVKKHLAVGRHHSVSASWFETSIDIPVNQCIKYAIWFLAEKYRLMTPRAGWRAIVSKLNHLFRVFGNVQLDLSKSFLKNKLVINPDLIPSLRDYYNVPLRLAKSIIENKGIEFDRIGDDILLPSLTLRMEEVFEKYVRVVLQDKFHYLRRNLRVLDGNQQGDNGGAKFLFDPPSKEKANPDIVIKYDDGSKSSYPLIIDVKYKNIERPDREDINQIISYGCSYRTPTVVILHPRKEGALGGERLLGKIDNLSVYQYAFDLANTKPEIEEEIFFERMLALSGETLAP